MKKMFLTITFVLAFSYSNMANAFMRRSTTVPVPAVEKAKTEAAKEEKKEEKKEEAAADNRQGVDNKSEPVAGQPNEPAKKDALSLFLAEHKPVQAPAPAPAPAPVPVPMGYTTRFVIPDEFMSAKVDKSATSTQKKSGANGSMATRKSEAQKPPSVSFLMAETKAYELFRNGNYDEASSYFTRMAKEKSSTLAGVMKHEGVDNIVKHYVDLHLLKFLVKGEFEKTTIYVERVNEVNRNKKIQALAGTVYEELKQRERKIINIRDFKLSRYYADEEAFQLSSPYGLYIVDVEIINARSFKNNFFKMHLKDLDFTADSGQLKLSYFTLVNPENNKRYPFISGLPTNYNTSLIELYYTARLGTGTPKVTRTMIDATRAIRSLRPLDPTQNTTSPPAGQPGAKITVGKDEITIKN